MGKNLSETRDMAAFQAAMNQINQQGPFGSLTFSGPKDPLTGYRDPTKATATTTLSPQMQAMLDQQMQAQRLIGQRGQQMLGQLPGAGQQVFGGGVGQFQAPSYGRGAETGVGNPLNLLNLMQGNTDFSAERNEVEQSTFKRAMALMNPEFNKQEAALQQRLANQGLPQMSGAYGAETETFNRGRNQAREQAAMAAVLAGGQEQSRMLADLIGTSQAGMGQAYANRDQRFGQALQGYGANLQGQQFGLQGALANRQIPFNEMMSLFGMQTTPTAGDFMAPSPTGLVNYGSTSAPGVNPAMGMLGGATAGAAAGAPFGPYGAAIGGVGGGLLGLFGSG